MSLVISLLRHHTPSPIKTMALNQLFEATAQAFETSCPQLTGLSYEDKLQAYAIFTAEQASKAIQDDASLPDTRLRLYLSAQVLGSRLRSQLRVREQKDVIEAAEVVYGIIGTELRGLDSRRICIPKCYFSPFYSADVCRLIGFMDAGLFAGLSGGSQLEFTERITEGHDCCRALLLDREQAR